VEPSEKDKQLAAIADEQMLHLFAEVDRVALLSLLLANVREEGRVEGSCGGRVDWSDRVAEYRDDAAVRRKRELERISELWNEEPTARLNALDNIRREQP